jgi:NAD+ synthase (glutamine-hydrolysing)
MNFHSIYSHGFARVAASTIVSGVADPSASTTAMIDAASACHEKSVAVAVFPELCLSGYAIENLLLQDALLDATERSLAALVAASTRFMSVLVVGAPLRQGARVYNCAVVVHRGRILGVVPKTYLPTYREFYEARHFGSGEDVAGLSVPGSSVPLALIDARRNNPRETFKNGPAFKIAQEEFLRDKSRARVPEIVDCHFTLRRDRRGRDAFVP